MHFKAISQSKLDTIKLDTLTEGGFIFRAGLKDEKEITKCGGFTVIDVTKGSGIKFVTKELEALSDRCAEIHRTYNELQSNLIADVLSVAREQTSKLHRLTDVLSIIDVLVSFSVIAANSSNGYVRPKLQEKGTGVFELIQCRHPVIEEKNDIQYIANDVNLHSSMILHVVQDSFI